jgi:preprotein translocase subunit SecY
MNKLFKLPELRKRILFTLVVIIVFRLFAHIPVPGVDTSAIKQYLQGNAIFGLFNLFSGGGFQNFSIVTLGLTPYINASIIMQLLMAVVPSLEEMAKEGEYGQEKIDMYTRLITVPLTLVQSYGIYFLLQKQHVISPLSIFDLLVLVFTITAGTMFLVWVGELVTEYGVGNGISLLIFVSIIGRFPVAIYGFFSTVTADNIMSTILFVALALAVVVAVVLVNEGTRNVVLEYGRSGAKSQKVTNFLPIKVNQAGVIPIIFAVSIVLIPSVLSAPLQTSTNATVHNIGYFLATNFTTNSFLYNATYFLLVVGFTYFYTAIQFNSDKISDDIKKRGGFIPGIRPGKSTAAYLKGIVNRVTLAGALFLGLIAILPFLVQSSVGVTSLTVGGTGLLIVVSVVLETIRQIESIMITRSYERFLD